MASDGYMSTCVICIAVRIPHTWYGVDVWKKSNLEKNVPPCLMWIFILLLVI